MISLPTDVPVIEFFLPDGTKGYALADTGSEVTSFDIDFVKKNKSQFVIEKTKNNMTMVNFGSSIDSVVIKASGELQFPTTDNDKLLVKVQDAMLFPLKNISENLQEQYDIDITIAAILGSDFFNKYGAKIDFKKKEISYYDIPCK